MGISVGVVAVSVGVVGVVAVSAGLWDDLDYVDCCEGWVTSLWSRS